MVTVRLRNESARPLALLAAPTVTVATTAGRQVYAGSQDGYPSFFQHVPHAPIGRGSLPFALLLPGQVRTYHAFVVLSGAVLRASVDLFRPTGRQRIPRHTTRLDTPSLRLRLDHEPKTRLTLHRSETGLLAVQRSSGPGERDTPLYMDIALCGNSSTGTLTWTQFLLQEQGAYQLEAPCYGNPRVWYVAAGWVGHPLARVIYRRAP